MATTVLVDGVTFYGTDPGGDAVMFTELEGWDDGPAARGEEIPRADAHGDHDAPVTRGPRLITLSGWARASTLAGLEVLRHQVLGVLAAGDAGAVTVTKDGVPSTATVRLYGEPRFKPRGASCRASWSLKLRAPNPRRYGATQSYGPGSSVSGIEHDGNFPASPVLEVAGSSGSGYTVTGPGGKLITVTTALASGHPHTIDLATGGLYVDGDRVLGGVSVYQPWTVPVGSSVSVSVSAGTVEVEVRDTFI